MAWEIGRRCFTDGLERVVYADADGGQFVFDDEGHKVVGVWLSREEIEADVALVVSRTFT